MTDAPNFIPRWTRLVFWWSEFQPFNQTRPVRIGYLRKHGKLDSGEIDFVVHWKTKFSLILQKIRSSNRKQTQILGGQLLVADSFEAGTHAYICNRAMAKRLVTFNNPVILAADLALIQVARSKQSKCFRSWPHLPVVF